MKYRMYFFVPYNISPIQQAIQAGHAALEYAHKFSRRDEYIDFIENDKTWIILNGGTTRSIPEDPGTMQELLNEIFVFNEQHIDAVEHSVFHEPDLNNAMTAICFLADERVWDYETYPDFYDWLSTVEMTPESGLAYDYAKKLLDVDQLKENFSEYYEQWVHTILGGEKNVFLRELLKGKKLA